MEATLPAGLTVGPAEWILWICLLKASSLCGPWGSPLRPLEISRVLREPAATVAGRFCAIDAHCDNEPTGGDRSKVPREGSFTSSLHLRRIVFILHSGLSLEVSRLLLRFRALVRVCVCVCVDEE